MIFAILKPILEVLATIIVPLLADYLSKPKQVKFYGLDLKREDDIAGNIDAARRRMPADPDKPP